MSLFTLFRRNKKSPIHSNEHWVNTFNAQNQNTFDSIRRTPMKEIVVESRRVAPLLAGIFTRVCRVVDERTINKLELQHIIMRRLLKEDLAPAMAGYRAYPAACAISIDDELIHGIPDETPIRPGSLLTIELSAASRKAYAAQTWSHVVRPGDPDKQQFLLTAQQALQNAIAEVSVGAYLGNIGHAIQSTIEAQDYSVVREYCGFAMGQDRIQEPQILGYGKPGTGEAMQAGQILNIQVLAAMGKRSIRLKADNWGVLTKSREPSVALSAMVLVTDNGHELLTRHDF